MRALIQRVSQAQVLVEGRSTGSIREGIVVFLGVRQEDTPSEASSLARRTAALRIFNDAEEKMNLSVTDVGGSILVVSQFTLHADTRKGNRPSFIAAALPTQAEDLYQVYVTELRRIMGEDRVATGIFRAMMQVELINDGPVTILLKSKGEYGV